MKKSQRLRNAEGPKNTFLELVAEKRLKYFEREVAHHATGTNDLVIHFPLSFGMTRPICNMKPGSACQLSISEFRVVAEQISTRDLVQEYLANRTSPTLSEFSMPKLKGTKKTLELVRLPYRFKFEK